MRDTMACEIRAAMAASMAASVASLLASQLIGWALVENVTLDGRVAPSLPSPSSSHSVSCASASGNIASGDADDDRLSRNGDDRDEDDGIDKDADVDGRMVGLRSVEDAGDNAERDKECGSDCSRLVPTAIPERPPPPPLPLAFPEPTLPL